MHFLGSFTDVRSPAGFGGLPYFLFEAGKAAGLFHEGSSFTRFQVARSRVQRVTWNLVTAMTQRSLGGYQYSDQFLASMWPRGRYGGEIHTAVSLIQLYPKRVFESVSNRYFYTDQTLHQLFHYYDAFPRMKDSAKYRTIERERDQYNQAEGVIFRSEWAATHAIEHYRCDPEKVHVIPPGANIHSEGLDALIDDMPLPPIRPSTIKAVFIGTDWRRKGLDRLLEVATLLNRKETRFQLAIIGVSAKDCPAELAQVPGVEFLGNLDKSYDQRTFVKTLLSSQLGCLASRAEAGGISLREFGRFGLPAIIPNTGGSKDFYPTNSRIIVDPSDKPEEIATQIEALLNEPGHLRDMVAEARAVRTKFDWASAVQEMKSVIFRN